MFAASVLAIAGCPGARAASPAGPLAQAAAPGADASRPPDAADPATPSPRPNRGPGRREPPAYRDDRSTPTAVIESLYNALNRHEYARAYSYWGADADKPDFKAFVAGYRQTRRIRLVTGPVVSEGAAGSTYFSVPVALRAVNADGTTIVFAGCYTVRLANPAIQSDPPFVPMHIEKSNILRARGRTSEAVPQSCPG